jgi:hypothetical protein
MQLEPYTASAAPPQDRRLALRPKLLAWSARVWRESPERAVPMFKLDAQLEVGDVEDKALARALHPFSGPLQKIAVYLLHPEETQRPAPWAVGRFDVDSKSAYMFFHNFLAASNGALMLNLMQTAGAATDIIMSVVPVRVEPTSLLFAISDYDLGIHNRIG